MSYISIEEAIKKNGLTKFFRKINIEAFKEFLSSLSVCTMFFGKSFFPLIIKIIREWRF